MINFLSLHCDTQSSAEQLFAAKHERCHDNSAMFFSSVHLKSQITWTGVNVMPARQVLFSYPPLPFVTNLSFLWEKENKCRCNAETQWEKWMFSFWKVDIFFWGGGAKNTPKSVPSRYATLITHLTLRPGVSSSLSEWLTCLSVLGWKQETCPPFWGGTTDWHLECSSPLINVNLLSKFAIGSVFLGQHFFAVFLLVVSCLFRNLGKCGKACPPEEDVLKIWSLTFKQAL